MRHKYPYKDAYDPAPYEALREDHRNGLRVEQRLADLIADTDTRPGFMATRLNNSRILAPNGGPWDWLMVRDAKDREIRERCKRGVYPAMRDPSAYAAHMCGSEGWKR